jgi:hypothetical protein
MAGVFFLKLNQIGHTEAPLRPVSAGQVSCLFARTSLRFRLKSMTFGGFPTKFDPVMPRPSRQARRGKWARQERVHSVP